MSRLRPSTVFLACLAAMAVLSWVWFFQYDRYRKTGPLWVPPQAEQTLLGQQVLPQVGPSGPDWRLGIQVKPDGPAGPGEMATLLPGPAEPGNPAVRADLLMRWISLWFMARPESGTAGWETVGRVLVGTVAHHTEMDLLLPTTGRAMIGFRWQGRIYRADMGNTAACLADLAVLRKLGVPSAEASGP